MKLILRYGILAGGVFLLCFGIAFITKAGLGTSPISSIPYTLSLIVPRISMGTFVVAMNLALLTAQWVLLRNKTGEIMGRPSGKAITPGEFVIQMVISVAMGYGVDFSLFLLKWIAPAAYWQNLLFLIAGILIMALGIYIQLLANVAMAPGDAFVRAVAAVTGKPFSRIRVISDSTMVSIAAILCLIFLHALTGVREGTVICALLTGNVIKVYKMIFERITGKGSGQKEPR